MRPKMRHHLTACCGGDAMPSTVIKFFRYDEAARVLTVTFTSGQEYQYLDVPPELVIRFRSAFSKGRFFASFIRDGFKYRRIHS